jgi:hypothetical protein
MLRTYRFLLGSTLISLLLFGCASKDFREPEIDGPTEDSVTRTFHRSYSDVWEAMVSALGTKKYAVSVSKRDGGLLVTDWISGKSDRLFSGYGDTRVPYTIRFKMTIRLTPTRGGVRVTAKNEEQYISDAISAGTDFSGSLYQWISTPSSGLKETALMATVTDHLASSAPREKK